jgi:hypothetical protein
MPNPAPPLGVHTLRAATSGELAVQAGHVRADPFFGEHAIDDPIELMADVFDVAARGGDAQELPPMGAAESEPEGNPVVRGDDVKPGCPTACPAT